jgi:hypothetical protein
LWGVIAIAGLAAVYFTRSRGGILGAALGTAVFTGAALVIGQRQKARWFAPTLMAIPVVGLAIGGFLFTGWQGAQEFRHVGSGIDGVWDNDCRLYFLGIALSCIGLHPLAGGGSRSFSWECFRFFENKLQGGFNASLPEQVHNELLQAATDYGIIGAALLIGLLSTLVILAAVRILFPTPSGESTSGDAWRLGGLAALAGMFVQSCFSFVFHLLPGVLLLGICLGQVSRRGPGKTSLRVGSPILLSVAALACVILLLPAGWKGTQVTQILWPSYFSKVASFSDEAQIGALTEAIRLWPQPSLYQERALVFQTAALMDDGPESKEAAVLAINDYEKAERLHPYDPKSVINRANLLSQLQRNPEAEDAYKRAIDLQGGMEAGFLGHLSLASHLLRKGLRQFNPAEPAAALRSLEIAAQHMEEAAKQIHWPPPDTRVSIHESLGVAREASGDDPGAIAAYDFTVTLYNGSKAHYRAGLLYGKMAASAWAARRPAEALGAFMEAKLRIGQAHELPQGVTPSQRIEYLAYLDRTITYLKGAKIAPVKANVETLKR